VLQQLSTAQLANAFSNLRTAKVDLLVVAISTPQLTQRPVISQQGLLQLVGFFPTQPHRIQFQIIYQPAGGEWRLAGLNVGLAQAAAADAKGADPKAAAAAAKAKAPAAPPTPPAKK
jgi:hypothetical protein